MAKPNPVVRGWKYMSAWFGTKLDEKADPKVQIEQAVAEAQRQHQALTQQAAAVIGNQRQLEMQLNRQLGTVENLGAQTRQALVLADQARASGDAARAGEFEQTAQALANQLVSAESSVEDLKGLHDQSLQAAAQARESVRTNAMMLQSKVAERTKLLSQLEQARMQETVSKSLQQLSDTAAPTNVPTLDEVRDKIERRYAVALGQAELAKESTGSRLLEVQKATMELQGSARLAQIRAALTADSASVPAVGTASGNAAVPLTADHAAVAPSGGNAAMAPAADNAAMAPAADNAAIENAAASPTDHKAAPVDVGKPSSPDDTSG